jgi:hypothetical protein
MKNLLCIVLLTISAGLFAQNNSRYSGTGNWSNAANWNPFIPGATRNANTSIGAHIFVDAVGECLDLSLFLSSLTINVGGILTIYGQYNATTTGTNTNNGTLILKGSLRSALGGTNGITVGTGGAVTTVSGLTFSTYSID